MLQTNKKNVKTTKELYSFDIFDTLVTRTVAYPVGIFTIMQYILKHDSNYAKLSDFIKDNFYTLRVEAESYVRINKFEMEAKQDITLKDIYDVIKNNQNLSDKDIQDLIDLEIATEIKNIKPIPQNIAKVKKIIEKGKRVILISDMYHTKDVLATILQHVDSIFSNIKIYVSSEYRISKHFGDLYDFIKKEENVEYSTWVHHGDNKYADIKQAKLKKINTVYLKPQELMPYEKNALKTLEEDFAVETLIGLARLSRTLKRENSKIYSFAASYAGPILFNYVNWIIQQALSRNISTLHFIARDGYVLKQLADIILKEKNINSIRTTYIYGSRIAWRIPNEQNIEEYINFICDEYNDRCTLEFIAKRFGIDVDLLSKFSTIKSYNKILKRNRIKTLKNNLLNNLEFKKYILEINKEKKELLTEYLKQELDLTGSSIAFVDVHGSGRTQDMLSDIIRQFSTNEIIGFYFHTDFHCSQKISKKVSYLSTGKYIHHSIELLCRTLDGQTIGYKKSANRILPILEKIDSTNLLNWGYKDYLAGISDFCTNACRFEKGNNISLQSYSLYKNYFIYLTKNLDKETADIIGSIPYQDIGSEKMGLEAASKYGIMDILKLIITGQAKRGFNFISLSRSSKFCNIIYKIIEKYGSTRKFLINLYIHKEQKVAYLRILGFKISFSRLIWSK